MDPNLYQSYTKLTGCHSIRVKNVMFAVLWNLKRYPNMFYFFNFWRTLAFVRQRQMWHPLLTIHAFFHRPRHDVTLRWCVISLSELQNNTGRFIMTLQRPDLWLAVQLFVDTTAPLRDPVAHRDSAAPPPASSRGGLGMLWCDPMRAARGGLALKSGWGRRPCSPLSVFAVFGAETLKAWRLTEPKPNGERM